VDGFAACGQLVSIQGVVVALDEDPLEPDEADDAAAGAPDPDELDPDELAEVPAAGEEVELADDELSDAVELTVSLADPPSAPESVDRLSVR
jgi:hypothetical protein